MIFQTGLETISVEDDTPLSRGECGGPAVAVVLPGCGEKPSVSRTDCALCEVCVVIPFAGEQAIYGEVDQVIS